MMAVARTDGARAEGDIAQESTGKLGCRQCDCRSATHDFRKVKQERYPFYLVHSNRFLEAIIRPAVFLPTLRQPSVAKAHLPESSLTCFAIGSIDSCSILAVLRDVITFHSRKSTSTLTNTATGVLSFIAGLKRHFFTASIAFSSKP